MAATTDALATCVPDLLLRRLVDHPETVATPHADRVDAAQRLDQGHGYGAQQAGTPPFFVTHSAPQHVRLQRELAIRLTFVHDLPTAVDQARTATTKGHVEIMGGGDVIGQAIEQGLVDELAPAPRTDSAGWRNTALPAGHAPAVSPT